MFINRLIFIQNKIKTAIEIIIQYIALVYENGNLLLYMFSNLLLFMCQYNTELRTRSIETGNFKKCSRRIFVAFQYA